ncbi:mitogen-activated protein kinase kinase kinase 14 isoform X2 [Dunckerocampus dactyliophorus]|uniref:mitogen-activated protein kinase kinase kinase 14 isoform X2 n=1 Tax=Dunckerocampus dactyliophorus TaxID=161453 RepID=UPI002406F6EA|nr:mitogen-activated protein kinase kinase kinase 14 isoform X2 [Dunckerocampus dactyliophorus]
MTPNARRGPDGQEPGPDLCWTQGGQEATECHMNAGPDVPVRVVPPQLSRAMLLGTAKHLLDNRELSSVSIVAQAEREDFQEFSPTDISDSQCHLLAMRVHQGAGAAQAEDGLILPHRHRHRKVQRPANFQEVQDTDWSKAPDDIIPPPTQFKDSQPLVESLHDGATDVHDASSSESPDDLCNSSATSESQSDDSDLSRCSFDVSHLTFDPSLLGHSGDGSAHSPSHTCLNTNVAPLSKLSLWPFVIHQKTRPLLISSSSSSSCPHQGFLLHNKLRPSSWRYREGEEYSVLRHIHSGSYGDVLCVRDKTSGFTCAAKKLPLSRFNQEEVTAWSILDSPHVVRLFGAVREGPNVVLFMDLKPASLAQLMRTAGVLPEDLALHFLHQSLGALQHLHHRKVLHLDVKVDNVLLSADCTQIFLCDFGLSRMLDDSGHSTKDFMGAAFPGTETHMAPEVARGDRLSAKVDVWSSCCMLLHMMTGRHPWLRRYSQPLCLHIANEPPPLWEVPSGCSKLTVKVFWAGLQKNPDRRASASQLRRNTNKALRAVGGLSHASIQWACDKLRDSSATHSASLDTRAPTMHWVSPWRTTAMDEDHDEADLLTLERECRPRSLRDERDWNADSDVDLYTGEDKGVGDMWLRTDVDYEGDWEDEGDEGEEEEEEQEEESTQYRRALRGFFPLLRQGQETRHNWRGSDSELEDLRDGVDLGADMRTPSPEPRDDPPSCFSSSSQAGASDKDSECSSDDLSLGVFSSCGGRMELLGWTHGCPSRCFEGVDLWIEDAQGECLRIRERQLVQVGHVAVGISEQVSMTAFTLETLDSKLVSSEWEIQEAFLWLRCVPAPDSCQRWTWRVLNGTLERRH